MTDDDFIGCGHSKLWATPNGGPDPEKKDPFTPACKVHDDAYKKGSYAQQWLTRKETDQQFLDHMLHIAGDNFLLQCRAYLYYQIVRLFAARMWEGQLV